MFKKIALANLVLLTTVLTTTSAHAQSFDEFLAQGERIQNSTSMFRPEVIYGDDDRLDWYDIKSDTLKNAARSEVALIEKTKLQSAKDGWVKINAKKYGDEMQMCSSERFVDQPTATFCSGFLVAPDKIVTAGHCIQSADECAGTSFVFDFALFNKDYNASQVPDTAVYNCKQVIHQELDRAGHDFAVVQLDRPVTDRQPIKLRRQGKVADDATLNVVGHPHGIPLKSATGKMRSNSNENFFVATLDTYGGNSGSMVLNQDTLEVEGILVRGEHDVDYDNAKGCYVSHVCKLDECNGEESTRISMVLPYVDGAAVDNWWDRAL